MAPMNARTAPRPNPGPNPGASPRPGVRGRWWRVLAWSTLVLLLLGGILAAWVMHTHVAPNEVLRYALRRVQGHPKLEWAVVPVLRAAQAVVERPHASPLPDGVWGQQMQVLPPQRFDRNGVPVPLDPTALSRNAAALSAAALLGTPVYPHQDLAKLLRAARPGQVLLLQPGTYKLQDNVRLVQGGTAEQPITVLAQPGQVHIEMNAVEGFVVQGPYWVFEGLTVRGVCGRQHDCEHAFHIVGGAKGVVLRNNRLEDFNAHVKVNGLGDQWPDHGLLQFNTLVNGSGRDTDRPVSPVDIVGASGWWVAHNEVSNFVKRDGNGVSYGIFMKGAGKAGVIHGNKVVCTPSDISQPGLRVGISLGGGGTGPAYCRDKACRAEHTQGRISDNVVVDCNDYGIYLNRAAQSMVQGNHLLNTCGIDVRFPESSAMLSGNVVDGIVRTRDGGQVSAY